MWLAAGGCPLPVRITGVGGWPPRADFSDGQPSVVDIHLSSRPSNRSLARSVGKACSQSCSADHLILRAIFRHAWPSLIVHLSPSSLGHPPQVCLSRRFLVARFSPARGPAAHAAVSNLNARRRSLEPIPPRNLEPMLRLDSKPSRSFEPVVLLFYTCSDVLLFSN